MNPYREHIEMRAPKWRIVREPRGAKQWIYFVEQLRNPWWKPFGKPIWVRENDHNWLGGETFITLDKDKAISFLNERKGSVERTDTNEIIHEE